MNSPEFLEHLRSQIQRDDLLARGAKVVVGVSGGADSTVLLHALCQIRADESAQYELHVAHLDHQLRGAESTGDAEFVAALADQWRLPKTIERCDLGSEADSQRSSPEDLARRARLRFFENVCKTVSATHVALAHHADDQVETVLHRFMRGTGFRGLSGMAIKRPLNRTSAIMLIKPLLAFSRREILDYAATHGLKYRHDSSNVSPDHTRNRIRRELLPLLESSFNPQIREAILRLARQSRWVNDFLRDTALTELANVTVERTASAISLDRNQVAILPTIVQTGVLRLAVESIGMRERRLTFRHVADIVEAIEKENTRGRFSLPDGVDVQFDRKRITVSRSARKSKSKKTSTQSEPIS